MRNKFIMVLGCVLLAGLINPATAQNERALAREGNEIYKKGTYNESEVKYRKALEINDDFLEARFNLGNAMVKQERYKQAIDAYEQVIDETDDKSVKAKAYHNMGNAHLENQKLKKSIEAYKNALRHNPNDPLTQYNLSYALKKLQDRQQKQQNQNQKDQQKQNQQNQKDQKQNKKNQQNQDQNKDQKDQNKQGQKDQQQNKDQQQQKQNQQQKDQQQANKDKDQQQSGKKDKEQDKQEKGKQQPKPKKGELTKKEAERLFRALEDQERETQRKLLKKRNDGKSQDVEKDW